MIEQARIEAQKITQEADEYVLVQLSELEQRFAHTLDEIRNGIQLMQYEEPVAVDVSPEAQAIQAPQNDGNAEPISFDRPAQAPMGSRL